MQSSLTYLQQATLGSLVTYLNAKFEALRGGVLNFEDDFESDMRRIRTVQTDRGGTEAINTETLPYLVISVDEFDREIMIKAPRPGMYTYADRGEDRKANANVGLFRMTKQLFTGRVYFTNYNDCMRFMESMYLTEDTNFAFHYKIDWLSQPVLASLSWDDVKIKKNSKLDGDQGQVYSVRFQFYVRGMIFSPPTNVPVIQQVNVDVYLTSFEIGDEPVFVEKLEIK